MRLSFSLQPQAKVVTAAQAQRNGKAVCSFSGKRGQALPIFLFIIAHQKTKPRPQGQTHSGGDATQTAPLSRFRTQKSRFRIPVEGFLRPLTAGENAGDILSLCQIAKLSPGTKSSIN